MSVKYNSENINGSISEAPLSFLERRIIRKYLLDKGYQSEDLRRLPKDEAKQLMKEACRYASLKLAEIESKQKFRKDIRGPDSS